jgi:phosphatidylinositol alpha-1,6-mannosyltransferase
VRLLFITRKWNGAGGMQRLSRDQMRLFRLLELQPVLCAARSGRDILFPFRALAHLAMAVLLRWPVHLGDAALAGLVLPLRACGLRVTVTACGLDVVHPQPLYQYAVRAGLRRASRVICISRATADAVQGRGVKEERIACIPCGFWPEDVPSVPPHPPGSRLLLLGRLVPRKGAHWFIESVFPMVRARFPHASLLIMGSGPEEAAIRSAIAKMCLQEAVEVRTDAADAERERAFANADLLVVPNIPVSGDMEGFGIVSIEAAARGVPVAASDLEGLRDAVLPGRTGALSPAGDAAAFSDTVCGLLEVRLTPVEVSAAAQNVYSWHALAERYLHALS